MKKVMLSVVVLGMMILFSVPVWSACPDLGTIPNGTGVIYGDTNCRGWRIALDADTKIPDLGNFYDRKAGRSVNVKDKITSMQIGRGLKCDFYDDTHYRGNVLGPAEYGNYPDLARNGWDNKISSIKCYSDSSNRGRETDRDRHNREGLERDNANREREMQRDRDDREREMQRDRDDRERIERERLERERSDREHNQTIGEKIDNLLKNK